MADCVVVAAPECSADGLMEALSALPGVAALSGIPLSSMLFERARCEVRTVRARRRAAGAGSVGVADDDVAAGLSVGPAVLGAVLSEVRSRIHCRHVVLHDCRGLVFPLVDAAGLRLIELVRNRWPDESAAKAAVRAALNAQRGPHRFRNLGGYLQVDQERLDGDSDTVCGEIMAFLEADDRPD